MISYGQRLLNERDLYAKRNGEMHILCHEMLGALEQANVSPDILHGFRERLHDVPQCRRVDEAFANTKRRYGSALRWLWTGDGRADHPMKRGY